MTKLTIEEVYQKIPDRFRNDVQIVEYNSYGSVILKTKYGLVKVRLQNLKKSEEFNIKSALDKTDFLKRMLLERFPNHEQKYTVVGTFINSNKPILVKGKYTNHLIKPEILLKGTLPHIKNSVCPTQYMVGCFNEAHQNKYSYSNFEYCGSSCMVKIECASHGQFIQKNYVHLMGSGCPACAQENKINGFGRTDFITVCKDREAIFYIVKCYNEQECFYKLGITSRSVKIRYKDKQSMPYNYETIFEHISSDPSYIWDLELKIKKANKEFSYTPDIFFKGGTTECFTTDLPVQEVIDAITF